MAESNTDILEMLKALANPTRLQIMQWLSSPELAFAGMSDHADPGLPGWGGACVSTIQKKAGASQPVISGYLKMMLQAGLLEMRRHEKWTYYRINRASVTQLIQYLNSWNR